MKIHHCTIRSAFILAGLAALSLLGGGCSRPSSTYSLKVAYSVVPPDDQAVTKWLESQPGLRGVSATRHDQQVTFAFGTDGPPAPDLLRELMGECEHLGYEKRLSYNGQFFDRSQRGTNRQTMWVEFATIPNSDEVMDRWLRAAPGISNPRIRRNGKIVTFDFDLANPPPPTILADILRQCRASGYEGQKGFITAFGRYD